MQRKAFTAVVYQSLLRRTFSSAATLKAQEAAVAKENQQDGATKKDRNIAKDQAQTVLKKAESNDLSVNDVISTISKLKTLVDTHGKSIVRTEEPDFELLVHSFVREVKHFSVINTANAILFFSSVGYKLTKQSEMLVKDSLLASMKRSSVSQILQFISFYQSNPKLPLDKRILDAAVSTIQKRWVEVSLPVDLARVMEHIKLFDENFIAKMEEAIVDVAEKSKTEDKIMLFSALYASRRRPTPALRALAYHLAKSSDKLGLKQCMQLLFALSGLSFHDAALIEKICNDAAAELNEKKTSSHVSRLATSLGIMRCRHKELLEKIAEWCVANPSLLDGTNFLPILITFATVDFQPVNSDSFFKLVDQKITSSSVKSRKQWVDAVWSMVLLGIAKPDAVLSVLSEPQLQKLSEEGEVPMATRAKLALVLSYAETIKERIPDYNSSAVQRYTSEVSGSRSKEIVTLSQSVTDALSNFLLPPKFLKVLTTPIPGVVVDAECILDRKFNPLELDQYDTSNPECKPLPADASRIAVVVQGYKDLCLGAVHPVGLQSLQRRLLESQGYKVVQVPCTDFPVTAKLQSKLKYLEQKLKEACDFKVGSL